MSRTAESGKVVLPDRAGWWHEPLRGKMAKQAAAKNTRAILFTAFRQVIEGHRLASRLMQPIDGARLFYAENLIGRVSEELCAKKEF